MARIRTVRRGDITCVIITGRVTAADMGRLEHACAPALVVQPSPLELDLRRVTSVDAIAHAILRRMVDRGARVHGRQNLFEA